MAAAARVPHTITIELWPGKPSTLWERPGIGETHYLTKDYRDAGTPEKAYPPAHHVPFVIRSDVFGPDCPEEICGAVFVGQHGHPAWQVRASRIVVVKQAKSNGIFKRVMQMMGAWVGSLEYPRPAGMTAKELKAELESRGLDTGGLKAELVERLDQARAADDASEDPPPADMKMQLRMSTQDTDVRGMMGADDMKGHFEDYVPAKGKFSVPGESFGFKFGGQPDLEQVAGAANMFFAGMREDFDVGDGGEAALHWRPLFSLVSYCRRCGERNAFMRNNCMRTVCFSCYHA